MLHKGTYTLLLALGLLSPLSLRSADARDRREDVRDARQEWRQDTREARRELREDLRRADDRNDVRRAYRDYDKDMRGARRDYRDDVRDYARGYSVTTLPRGARVVNMRGERLYYANGVYYRPAGPSRFVIVRP